MLIKCADSCTDYHDQSTIDNWYNFLGKRQQKKKKGEWWTMNEEAPIKSEWTDELIHRASYGFVNLFIEFMILLQFSFEKFLNLNLNPSWCWIDSDMTTLSHQGWAALESIYSSDNHILFGWNSTLIKYHSNNYAIHRHCNRIYRFIMRFDYNRFHCVTLCFNF